MRVQWSEDALADLLDASVFVAADDETAAETMQQRLITAAEKLGDFPDSGRLGRRLGTREKPVARTPYLMVYTVEPDRVVIARLWHGAREPQA